MKDTEHHCEEDGNMVTFVDDGTSHYGHKDPAKVTRVTNKNFAAIETYMHSNKLKVNSDKMHLLVIAKSSRGEMRGSGAAGGRHPHRGRRANQAEQLRGADGKVSVQAQLRSRVNALKKICQHADIKTKKMVAAGIIT